MTAITNTSQLNVFSLVRGIIRTDATLGAKFAVKDFYEFEPKHKAASFGGFPYFIIKTPETDEPDTYLGNTLRNKEFEVEITLVMDYEARGNYANYASRLVSALDGGQVTLAASGYNLQNIGTSGVPQVLLVDQKELVEGKFTLTLIGDVRV